MDANGTRYQLLLGYDDWGACTDHERGPRTLRQTWEASPPDVAATDLAWNGERAELTLRPRLLRFTPAPRQVPPTLEDRRGAARDRYGNWYWIDANRQEIRVNSAGTGNTSHFWSVGDGLECISEPSFGGFQPLAVRPPPALLPLSGLTVTEDHYLVAGVLEPAGLVIFDLYAVGPPRQVLWPKEIPFVPFDMAPAPGGGVWILDRAHARYWALDCHFRVIPRDQADFQLAPPRSDDFQPQAGGPRRLTPARTFPAGISLNAASPVATRDPIAIEALPDGTVLILDRNPGNSFSLIFRYRFGRQLGQPVSTEVMAEQVELEPGQSFTLTARDFAFVAEHQAADGTAQLDRLYVVAAEGDQGYAFLLSRANDQLVLEPLTDYLPMRLFGGKGLVTAAGQPYYDFADRWIPLVAQRRPRYAEQADVFTPAGATGTGGRPAFDGRQPDCVWHRLLLDACLPPETAVQVWSRAANSLDELARTAWRPEPALYQRGDGSELPFVSRPIAAGAGTWELLLQRARGQYLQLWLRLLGNRRSTPRLRALRAYYPRFSYPQHYLPAVYREDPDSASFLERFLANPEGFFTAIEDKIAAAQILFDPRTAPADALPWLARWFGVVLDPVWDEARRRLFLLHAMDFFQYRGTIRGLVMALRLVHEPCADQSIFSDPPDAPLQSFRIVEQFRTRRTPGVVLGDPGIGITQQPATPTSRWQPQQGSLALNRRYTAFLAASGTAPGPLVAFPLQPPADQSAAWTQFAQTALGFVPSATAADLGRWQDFLTRRYRRISTLNAAYHTSWTAFTAIPLPLQLPPDGAPLVDWYQFEAVVLVMRRTAHRFTVLLPAPKTDTPDGAEHRRRLDLTRRVIDLEKPAHTVYDIKFHWAYFRVGEARLGDNSILDRGSRSPELLPPLVLGQGYLAGAYLAPGYPQNVTDRQLVGRDRLGR